MVVRSPPIRRSSENYPFDSRGDCLLAASSQRPSDDYWQNLRLALLPWYEIPATNSHYVCITSSCVYSCCIPPSLLVPRCPVLLLDRPVCPPALHGCRELRTSAALPPPGRASRWHKSNPRSPTARAPVPSHVYYRSHSLS